MGRASPTPKLQNPFELYDTAWARSESIEDLNFREENTNLESSKEPTEHGSEIYIKHKADPVHEKKVQPAIQDDVYYGSTTAGPILASPTPKLRNAFEFIDNTESFEEELIQSSGYLSNPSWHASEILDKFEHSLAQGNKQQEIFPDLYNPNPIGRPVRFEETPFPYPEVRETVKLKRQIRWPDK